MLNEPFFVDDDFRVTPEAYAEYLVTQCDTLVCKSDEKIVGIAVFSDIRAQRSAEFIGWISPAFREGFSNQKVTRSFLHGEVLDYAWNDLKLVKLEAWVYPENTGALALLTNLGFKYVGECAADMKINGELVATMQWELVNPVYRDLDDLPERVKKQPDEDEDDAAEAEGDAIQHDGALAFEPAAAGDSDDEFADEYGADSAAGEDGTTADDGWSYS